MCGTRVVADARVVSTIAAQLRTARHRRARRRRAAVALLVAAPVAVLGARLRPGAEEVVRSVQAAATDGGADPIATGLDPGLVRAFVRAQAAAADAGHRLTITSGYRTADEQAALLEDEVAEQGSLEEALWWVFPPDRSMHVRGLALDVGDGAAADWLAEHGARFGLCRTLTWEWWHVEWRARWEAAGACPAPAETPEAAPGV